MSGSLAIFWPKLAELQVKFKAPFWFPELLKPHWAQSLAVFLPVFNTFISVLITWSIYRACRLNLAENSVGWGLF